jgi:BA14K-like protein
MSKLMNKISILGVSVVMLATSILPSQAAMPMVAAPQVEKQVVEVQYRDRWDRGERWDRRYDRRYDRRHDRYDRRHHGRDNSWVPLAAGALIAGAVIAGSAAAQPRYVEPAPTRSGVNPRHYEYCSGRYRSYDAYSNTFQPYSGPRQQCYSPYY